MWQVNGRVNYQYVEATLCNTIHFDLSTRTMLNQGIAGEIGGTNNYSAIFPRTDPDGNNFDVNEVPFGSVLGNMECDASSLWAYCARWDGDILSSWHMRHVSRY